MKDQYQSASADFLDGIDGVVAAHPPTPHEANATQLQLELLAKERWVRMMRMWNGNLRVQCDGLLTENRRLKDENAALRGLVVKQLSQATRIDIKIAA